MKSGATRSHLLASIAPDPPCPSLRRADPAGQTDLPSDDGADRGAIRGFERAPAPAGIVSTRPQQPQFPAAVALWGSRRERTLLQAAFPEAGSGLPDAVAVWSASRYRRAALLHARAFRLPALLLAPGLLRAPPGWGKPPSLLSVTAAATEGLGSSAQGLSADCVLRLRGWETSALLDRAAVARRQLIEARVGGEWWHGGAAAAGDAMALVIANEANPYCSPAIIEAMLAAALAENPPNQVILLAAAQSCLRRIVEAAAARGCAIIDRPVDPWALIGRSQQVYCAGGETGFLALIAGCEVRCFAHSLYAGWGVTADDVGVPQQPFRRTVEQIFAAATLIATRCVDPFRGVPAEFEDVVAILADWRRAEAANRRIVACLGMSWWKRRWIAEFLRSADGPPRFCRTPAAALAVAADRPAGAVAVWASRIPAGLVASAARQGTPLVTVEDGFIRSVGLGSDFVRAASLALDWSGTHCDPAARSDLERLLLETEFDPALLRRARDLINRLVFNGISKYNLKGKRPQTIGLAQQQALFSFPSGRCRLLVPGQVEGDLSVRLGGGDIHGNLDLLARVRTANPDAFIVYKPHPDVVAGHRLGAVPSALAREFADTVLPSGSIASILNEVDEVHILTSLTGFEALLRRRKVVVYGRPFYAGWGLTNDLVAIDRGRRLSLEELVAGALILYPRYLDPITRWPCAPEIVVDRLAHPELWRAGPLVTARRMHGLIGRYWNRLQTRRRPLFG